MARYEPVQFERLTPEHKALYENVRGKRPKLVGPFSVRLKQVFDEERQFYMIIRDVLVAHLNGNAPQVSVEIGRGNVPSLVQPSFFELEEALNSTTDG